jgi:hypothetical protein
MSLHSVIGGTSFPGGVADKLLGIQIKAGGIGGSNWSITYLFFLSGSSEIISWVSLFFDSITYFCYYS